MGAAHARLGPSSAHRWLRCPASIPLSEQLPPRPSGSAAAAGTMMHSVFERRLLNQHDFTSEEIKLLEELDFAESRARLIVDQAEVAVHSTMKQHGLRDFLTETRVDPGAVIGRKDFWGTADLIAADPNSATLLVGDLKTGRGRVEVEFNDQLLAYAVGAESLLKFTPRRVLLVVFQPPVYGSRAAVWETTTDTLRDFSKYALERAQLTDSLSTPPTPSHEACQWCPARTICPAHRTS